MANRNKDRVRTAAAVIRYAARSLAYGVHWLSEPAMRILGRTYRNIDPAFWNRELAGSKSVYLDGYPSSRVEIGIMKSLAAEHIDGPVRVLDVGCGGGNFFLVPNGLQVAEYFGIDISEHAIAVAKGRLSRSASRPIGHLSCADMRSYQPPPGLTFDLIVFSEVLYYLRVVEAAEQAERYSRWLSERGVVCIGLKDDPKSHAILRQVRRRLICQQSVLFQLQRGGAPRFRIGINRDNSAMLVSLFMPRDRIGEGGRQ